MADAHTARPGFLVTLGVEYPRATAATLALVAAVLIALVALPSVSPERFTFLHPVQVDTDPENMLRADEEVRVFHRQMKSELALHEMVVLGVVNEEDPDGVFNPDSLARVHELTQFARGLQWPDPEHEGRMAGVVEVDLMAPSTVDVIETSEPGTVRFEWLMPEPPQTREEARAIRDKARRIPLLDGTLIADDGKALAIYVPLTSKHESFEVARRLLEYIERFDGADQWHVTGLPVAEDTFGVEMFRQMAISAPGAMLVIFSLMLFFFRRLVLVVAPMIVALASVIVTMGLLVTTGNTVHIMTSMIPVFIMPIAVLDSVHVLSEFFDRYPATRDRRQTILEVMTTLFRPMLFTSITSIAGFASLALTPIPPVQTFGVFVAVGIAAAWLITIVFVPAYVMLIPEKQLEGFGAKSTEGEHTSLLSRALARLGPATKRHAKAIVALSLLAIGVAGYGISRIEINDNPVRWFAPSHPIRVADRVLNEHFAGTYMGYLAIRPVAGEHEVDELVTALERSGDEGAAMSALTDLARAEQADGSSADELLASLRDLVETQLDTIDWDAAGPWEDAAIRLDEIEQHRQVFKSPQVLEWMGKLQEHLLTTGVVGKSSSIADIVKTVYRDLASGEAKDLRIPDSAAAVAQSLITYESSHRPGDLWHFVTPDFRTTSLWIQLKSGDNRDMSTVVDAVAAFTAAEPAPVELRTDWFGLTYINIVWQERMVAGMAQAFGSSFVVVLVIMTLLFRSLRWGALAMIPLTLTIAFIYGVIGLVGKDYDMPVAVLSSLALGLSVDFAIHFLARTRTIAARSSSWDECLRELFDEPARAIARNVIVVAVGFTPLIAATLAPYRTVGVLIASILMVSGLATMTLLPALLTIFQRSFFPPGKGTSS